jgi:hypothetical protein
VYDQSSSDICFMFKNQRHGPETTKAINTMMRIRRLNCNEVNQPARTAESPEQREQRINRHLCKTPAIRMNADVLG